MEKQKRGRPLKVRDNPFGLYCSQAGVGIISKLVKITGITKSTIARIRQGLRCSYATAEKLSDATGLSIPDILNIKDKGKK